MAESTTETRRKQPKELYMLFFTEMWERFSFYGMRSLLTLYMTLQLFDYMADPTKKATAYGIYAAYGALVYATPYIGGLLADRLIGYKKSTLLGGVLMMIGHFVMAIETEFFLYLALAFLIVGNGFFKPNISSMVGGLYDEGDSRRDGGFTIFYMGINLGAFLAPLICGYIGETYGWFYGFGLAGIGMLLGLIVFETGKKNLAEDNGGIPDKEKLYEKVFAGLNREHLVYIGSVVTVILVAALVRYYELVEVLILFAAIGGLSWVFIQSFSKEKVDKQRIWVIVILTFVNIFFWAFFEQAGSSLTLLTESNVNRKLFGAIIPASVFQSVNPAFILILGPMFASMWVSLNRTGREPSTPLKFVFGMVLLGIGFLALVFGVNFVSVIGSAALIPLIFLILSYMLQTCGELSLSPVGLSMITKLAPRNMTAQLMGLWFLSTALSHTIAGQIAKLTTGGSNEEVAAVLSSGVKQVKLSDEDFRFSEKERQKLLEWKEASFVNEVEQLIANGYLSDEQVSAIASGDQYTVKAVLEDSLKHGKLEGRELELLSSLARNPLHTTSDDPELDKKVSSILTSSVQSGEVDWSPEEVATLEKWGEGRFPSREKFQNTLDTLRIALDNQALSKKQVEVLALQHSDHAENALDDSLKHGNLQPEQIAMLTGAAREPGSVAVENGVLTQEKLKEYEPMTLSSFDQLSNYSSVYQLVGYIAVGTGLVLVLLIPVLRKWMHGVH